MTKPKPKQLKIDDNTVVAGKPLRQWDACWVRLKGGLTQPHPDLRHQVGLYRTLLSDEVTYIGQATEHNNGGLQKRLADFRRKSSSARQHSAGRRIFKHNRDAIVEVLITGSDRAAARVATQLKREMLRRKKPHWNCA